MKLFAPHATDEDILDVFYELGAGDFVKKFTDGMLDFKFAEQDTLNDSAKNLLNIVRAVLKPASIHVFNQCFDHVKAEHIVRLMAKLKRSRQTCLFITYDRNVCRAANNIFVMKGGRVVGQGKHRELLSSNAEYKKFYAATSGTILQEENIEEAVAEAAEIAADETIPPVDTISVTDGEVAI